MEEQILVLSRAGCSDREIADRLTAEGYRSPRCQYVLESTVRNLRLRHRILLERSQSHPRRPVGHLTVAQLAQQLGVEQHWIYARIYNDRIQVARDRETDLYLFPDQADTLEQFRKLKAGEVKTIRL